MGADRVAASARSNKGLSTNVKGLTNNPKGNKRPYKGKKIVGKKTFYNLGMSGGSIGPNDGVPVVAADDDDDDDTKMFDPVGDDNTKNVVPVAAGPTMDYTYNYKYQIDEQIFNF